MNNEKFVSIVIPSLNEEKNIQNVLINCLKAIKKNKLKAELILMDSSTDNTSDIAEKLGVKVYKTAKKGLGYAYIKSLKYIKGEYVVMGDADGTYDFLELDRFIKKLDEGYDFVMGTRLKGWIEKDAMPKLHRYFGTPFTTWILNKLFKMHFSDIHCGLRALTKKAFIQMDLKSNSWEYASEMVIKSSLLKLKSTEIPIHFYKDKFGRLSQHKRLGWFSSWYAGWINLKIMLIYAPNFIFSIPGTVTLLTGILITITSTLGLIKNFQYHFALLGLVLTTIGYLIIQLGIFSKLFSDLNKYYKDPFTKWIKKYYNYNSGMITGFIIFFIGILFNLFLVIQWYANNFKLNRISIYGTIGLTLIVIGSQTIFFTFLYELFSLSKK